MGPLNGPEFIKPMHWVDKFRAESQRAIFNDLWYDLSGFAAAQCAGRAPV
jgi:hypothetical protein